MSAQDQYISAIEDGLELGVYHAMWPAGHDAAIGEFGQLADGAFDSKGSLQQFHDVPLGKSDAKPDGLTYSSRSGIDVTLSGGAKTDAITEVVTNVALGVKVTFHRKDQVALRAVGVKYRQVLNARDMAKGILKSYNRGEVEMKDYFVTGIITAESGAAVVSDKEGASVELTGKGDLTPGGAISLANLKANIDIASTSDTSLQVPMANGFVIGIRLVQLVLKGIIWVRPEVVDRVNLTADLKADEPEYLLTFDDLADEDDETSPASRS